MAPIIDAVLEAVLVTDPNPLPNTPADRRKKVGSINIVNPGRGYATTPFIGFNGIGKGAIANVTMNDSDGSIESVNLISGGHGYLNPPTIFILEQKDPDISRLKCSNGLIRTIPNSSLIDSIEACENDDNCKYAEYNTNNKTAKLFNEQCTDNYLDSFQDKDRHDTPHSLNPTHNWNVGDNTFTYNKDLSLKKNLQYLADQIKLLIPASTPQVSGDEYPHIRGLDFFLSALDVITISVIISNAYILFSDLTIAHGENIVKILENSKLASNTPFSTYDLDPPAPNPYLIISNHNPNRVCKSFSNRTQRDHAFIYGIKHSSLSTWGCFEPINLSDMEMRVYNQAKQIVNSLNQKLNSHNSSSSAGNPRDHPENVKNTILMQLANKAALQFINQKVNKYNTPGETVPDGYFGVDQNPIEKYKGPSINDINDVNPDGVRPKDNARSVLNMIHTLKGSIFSHCSVPEIVAKEPHALAAVRVSLILMAFDAVRKHISPLASYEIINEHYEDPEVTEEFTNYNNKKESIKNIKSSFSKLPKDLMNDVGIVFMTGKNRNGREIDRQKLITELSIIQQNILKKKNVTHEKLLNILNGN